MRLHSRSGATTLTHEGKQYEADPDGGFDLPEDVGARLHPFPDWETTLERHQREFGTEQARKRDPAASYDEVAALRAEVEGIRADLRSLRADLLAPAPEPAAPRTRSRAPRPASEE
jgi:hypothetical protein